MYCYYWNNNPMRGHKVINYPKRYHSRFSGSFCKVIFAITLDWFEIWCVLTSYHYKSYLIISEQYTDAFKGCQMMIFSHWELASADFSVVFFSVLFQICIVWPYVRQIEVHTIPWYFSHIAIHIINELRDRLGRHIWWVHRTEYIIFISICGYLIQMAH